MASALVHRGPDSSGCYIDPEVGLTMRRLSIIDLETGSQPVKNEDGSVWTVFNGEIYNYAELRRGLSARGHRFSSATDTETIVHLYEDEGADLVKKLRGMFAIALWDRRRRELLLARDRLGIKPLYYAILDGRLLFASEVKAIVQLTEVARKINWRSVSHLLTALSTPPAESILEGIHKLEPGHVLVASPDRGVRIERYWEFRMEPDTSSSEAQLEERLRDLLEESTKLHLASDVPVGAFLSGGIDSSAVVAMMARSTGAPIKTFSIGFAEDRFDERKYARLAASAIGTEHHETTLRPESLDLLESLTWHLDEPFGDPSAIPTYIVSKLAAQHVKVVLSGDGGDEIFAGYEKYMVERGERRWRRLPGSLRRVLATVAKSLPDGLRGRNYLRHISLGSAERYLDALTLFTLEEKRRLLHPDVIALLDGDDPWGPETERLRAAGGHWLPPLQSLDVRRYLPLDILTKVDRMSMAHSIEARVPLLDHKLVEFAATLPPDMNLRGTTTKYLFKRAMRGILPREILERPKQGFAVPLGDWFRGDLRGFIRDVLLSDTATQRGFFNTARIEQLLHAHDQGRQLDLHLWTLVSLELWCRMFLDGKPERFLQEIEWRPRPRVERLSGQEVFGSAA